MIFLIMESWVTSLGVIEAQVASTPQGILTTVFVRFLIVDLSFLMIMAGRPPCLPLGRA